MKTVEVKLYPSPAQVEALESWLRTCCWIYNKALEQRKKAYARRGQSLSFYDQCKTLTGCRNRMPSVKAVPLDMGCDALRRIERGMDAFFRRVKAGQKPGFPRFRSRERYNSVEVLVTANYVRPGNYIHVPKLGLVKFRGGNQSIPGIQRLLRVIRRASGWYAQVLIETPAATVLEPSDSNVGIDVGLTSFATLSTGEKIDNPRWARKSAKQVRKAQKEVSRKQRRSKNRRKAIKRLQAVHEKIAARRRDFAHQLSRRLINQHGLIAFENLNIGGMSRGHFAKSIMDAAWGQFLQFVVYKAEYAGRQAIAVDPRGTSQTCPDCGTVKKKELRERTHKCSCGLFIDRDHAAARVILARALGVAGVVEGSTAAKCRKTRGKSARRSKSS